MTDQTTDDDEGPKPLFAIWPTAKLAAIAGAAGIIAVFTITVEILTGRLPAQFLGYSTGFVSLPLGAAIPILTALTARTNVRYAMPGLVLSIIYWSLFVMYL